MHRLCSASLIRLHQCAGCYGQSSAAGLQRQLVWPLSHDEACAGSSCSGACSHTCRRDLCIGWSVSQYLPALICAARCCFKYASPILNLPWLLGFRQSGWKYWAFVRTPVNLAFQPQHKPFVQRYWGVLDILAIDCEATEANRQLAQEYAIRSFPTFVLLHKGHRVDQVCNKLKCL